MNVVWKKIILLGYFCDMEQMRTRNKNWFNKD